MKTLLLASTLALAGAAPVAGQTWQTPEVQTRVFQHLAQNANAPEGADFVAACAGIRDGARIVDPPARVLATAGREAQSRDSIWSSLLEEAAEAGDPVSWVRPRNSIEVLVPASKCAPLTEALGSDLRGGIEPQVAILLIDDWITRLDGSFEISALIGPAPLRRYQCSGWIEPRRSSVSCAPEGWPPEQ